MTRTFAECMMKLDRLAAEYQGMTKEAMLEGFTPEQIAETERRIARLFVVMQTLEDQPTFTDMLSIMI
jgi:hypothetical protein